MKKIISSNYRLFFLFGLFIFLITAFFSQGYHHPDEHFQILEFCNYKLGNSPAVDLPWEFYAQIRPTLQPSLTYVFFKIFKLIGVVNPFRLTLFLRVLSALFAWYISCLMALLLENNFSTEKGKKYFFGMIFFLWFIPYLSVRYSSENWSGLVFMTSLYLILKNQHNEKNIFQYIIAGFLLGCSVFFRFQIGFAIIGLGLWLIFVKKISWKTIIVLSVPCLLAIFCCWLIDYWFYGKQIFTPINYFVSNIIDHKAAGWGTDPWWFYFSDFILKGIPPISILLLILFFIGLFYARKNIFSWIFIPFLLAHVFTAHKELRFLFPLVFAFIYLAAIGFDQLIFKNKINKFWNFMIAFSICVNIPLLAIKMITPAQEAVCYYHYLYDYSSDKKINLLCAEKSIYNVDDLNVNFYKSPNVNCIVFKDKNEIPNYVTSNQPDSIFVIERRVSDNLQVEGYSKIKKYSIFPEWLLRYNIGGWQNRSRIWTIYEWKREK